MSPIFLCYAWLKDMSSNEYKSLNPQVKDYLNKVRERLYLEPAAERQVICELYSNFEERIADLKESGYTEDEAARLATKSFGRPKEVGRLMHEAHSQRSWGDALLAALPHFLVAIIFGLGLWYHLWIPVILAPIAASNYLGMVAGQTVLAVSLGRLLFNSIAGSRLFFSTCYK